MPAPTSDWQLVNVRWRGVLMDGSPAQGTVSFTASAQRFLDDDPTTPILVFGSKLVADIDVNGEISIDLPATDDPDITPVDFTYLVEEKLTNGVGGTYSIEVPLSMLGTGVEIPSYAPVASSPGVPLAIVTRAEFDAQTKFIILDNAEAVPGGTATGTLIFRRP